MTKRRAGQAVEQGAGRFTGRHMTAILVGFFGVVIAVNLTMARLAGSTFGGVVVENSYVASQHFNRWLDEAAKENALGLGAEVTRQADHRVSVVLAGAEFADAHLTAVARHPLGRLPDRVLTFDGDAHGRFVSREVLPAGRWRLRLELAGRAGKWRAEQEIQ